MKTDKKLRGVVPPMITPLTPGGALDESATCRVIDFTVDGGVDGIFVLGTTGEGASVSPELRRRFVQLASEHLRGRAHIYVGIGDNCLARCLEAADEAFRFGADAVVAHLACYYPLSPDEMYDYFKLLADRVSGPLVLYNIPATTHLSVPVEVVARLSGHPCIVGFKDSESTPGRIDELARKLAGKDDFSLFMGAAALSAKALALGMDGVVPSSGNLDPRDWRAMCDAAQRGDWQEAERLQERLDRIAQVYQRGRTLGQSLAALKAAMSVLGLCTPCMLAPLHALEPEEILSIRAELHALGLAQ